MAFIHAREKRFARFLDVIIGIIFLIIPRLGEAEELPACRKKLTLDRGLYEVYAVAFSPDGSAIASASADGVIRVWDTATGSLFRETRDIGGKPLSLAYSPAGSTLAVGMMRDSLEASKSGQGVRTCWGAILLDTMSALPRGEFWGENYEGKQITFFSDGNTLVTSRLRGLSCWELTTGRRTDIVRRGVSQVDRIATTAAGDQLALADNYRNIYIYKINNKEFVDIRNAHRRKLTGLAFSPDGSSLASGSLDHEVKVWQTATGKESWMFHKKSDLGCVDQVLDVRFSSDGKEVVSAHSDNTVKAWDPVGRRFLRSSDLLLSADFQVTSMVFSPNGKSLGAIGFVRQVGVRADLPPSWKIVIWDLPPSR
jgi:WD40 repeat protein